MYEPSYLNNSYDEIVDDDEFNKALSNIDINSLNKINNIKEREERMFKKINEIHNLSNKHVGNCNDDICSVRGNQRFEYHRNIKNNIEDYNKFYDNQSFRNNITNKKKIVDKSESFNNNSSDIEFFQNELKNMERKNNNLVIFLILLVIIILIQYTKSYNNDIRFMMIPNKQLSNNEQISIES